MYDFWQKLNKELGFIFVSGVPSEGFETQINTMDSDYMHFVPSVNLDASIGLAMGAFISGFKACVLVENSNLVFLKEKLDRFTSLINTPIIIITNGIDNPLGLKQFEDDVTEVDDYVYGKGNSAIIVVR